MTMIAITVFLGRASTPSSFAENSLPVAIVTSSSSARQNRPEKRRRVSRERANSPLYFLFRCFDISQVKQY